MGKLPSRLPAILAGFVICAAVAHPRAQGGPSPAQIQAALRAFLLQPHTWAGAQTFAGGVILGAPLPVASGGTGLASYAIGDLIYASGATTLSKLADVGAGAYLRSGGITTAPLWSTLLLPNAATTGDLFYASAANTMAALADVAAGSFLRSGGTSTAPLWSTTTLPNSATTGDLLYASATNGYANLAAVASGMVLASAGVTTAPAYTANPLVTTLTASVDNVGVSTTDGLIAQNSNSTPAALGAQQMSSRVRFRAYGWGTTAGTSQSVDSWLEVLPIQGTVPQAQLQALTSVAGGASTVLWTATPGNFTTVAAVRPGTGFRLQTAANWVSMTAPTISSGFGSSPSITASNGTGAFRVNVGTGGSASSGVIGLPAATTGWNCHVEDLTTESATVFRTKQTASSTTTATVGNFDNTGAAAAWTASDILAVACFSY
jgi:hypothetical protein